MTSHSRFANTLRAWWPVRAHTPCDHRRRRKSPSAALVAVLVVLAPGCGDGSTTEPAAVAEVTVSAVEPAAAEQGETLEVRILGERFADDALVSWTRNGVPSPLIVVEEITFVSETELIASISVAPEAEAGQYDVVVRSERSSGQGVGVQLFEVASYVPLTVLAAQPARGEQRRTVQVLITGTGFLDDAEPAWERDGVADPLIVVEQVVFVSGTELWATITIAAEADLGLYDISVSSKRKKGIGSEDPKGTGDEIFTVDAYTPEPLGWLVESIWAGAHSSAYAINDDGVVAGYAVDAGWNPTAVYWTPGGGPVSFGGEESIALGSNNRGWIVGARGIANDLVFAKPFIFENGVVTDLQPLQAPHRSHALGINEAGTIVGWGSRDYWADPTWPVVWVRSANGTYGAPVELPLPGGQVWQIDDHQEGSQAAAINHRGDVAGTLRIGLSPPDQVDHAVLWKVRPDGTYEEPLILGGKNARAVGMNDAGWIVGSAEVGQLPCSDCWAPRGAVLWHPADYSTPILLSGWDARAINDAGQIVGTRHSAGNPNVAALWTVDALGNTTMTVDLVPSDGNSHSEAFAINAHGWVVGRSEQFQPHRSMATLWRPEN
jgi:uncharacterized membrane protein